MIKNNRLAVLLVTALFLSALASCWSSLWWFLGTRELQALEFQSQSMTRVSNAMQSLAGDAVEYGRRNPGIDGVLTRFDLKPRAGAGTPAPTTPKTR
jgi:hypothetical protein